MSSVVECPGCKFCSNTGGKWRGGGDGGSSSCERLGCVQVLYEGTNQRRGASRAKGGIHKNWLFSPDMVGK